MAEFLNRKKLVEWIPKLIESAEKDLIIISPYIQISERILQLLRTAEKKGVEITSDANHEIWKLDTVNKEFLDGYFNGLNEFFQILKPEIRRTKV